MLTEAFKTIEPRHTDWYDLSMVKKAHQWRVWVLGAVSLSLLGNVCAAAEDQPQLRPAYPAAATHADNNIDSKKSAAQSVDSDYNNHLNSLKRLKKYQPPSPAATGASKADTAAAMGAPNPGSQTPASATGDSTASGDEIVITAPRLESLISVNEYLNPFSLDGSSARPITLKEALDVGLERNLDLAISLTQTKQSKFSYYSALGKFLPDATAGFSEYFARGHVGLPFNIFASQSLSAGALSNTALGGAASKISSNGKDSTVTVNRPFEIMHAGAEYYVYRGGSVVFGALQSRNNYRARIQGERATLSDTLLTIAQNYYNLVLAETLLEIRIDAVRTSEEQLRLNQARFRSGLATNLEVLQSKTQLSRDKQALVDQQIERRSSAIALANTLNLDLGADLKPSTTLVQKVRLIDPHLSVGQVLQMAIEHRPELKQYEQLRLAAKKGIIVSTSGLQPTVSVSGQAYGIGPPSNVNALGVFSVNANWRLKGLATTDSMEINRAKWEARQAALQSQKELQVVCEQVRNSYLKILDKERNISEASNEVISSAEELRLAELRKTSGLGLNLDIITAQRDYTQARVSKAQAIIDYNIAQVQLLHDTGQISIAGLTSGRMLNKTDL